MKTGEGAGSSERVSAAPAGAAILRAPRARLAVAGGGGARGCSRKEEEEETEKPGK